MKRFFVIALMIFVVLIPISYADEFDTNLVSVGEISGGEISNQYMYWAYYIQTGTRYVLRVYDWNSQKWIAVPKEYYINHVQGNNGNEIMYLGVDKSINGKYDIVKSGKQIFADTTYAHVLKWYDNPNVERFGLSKSDVNLLAEVIQQEARKRGNTSLVKNMQQVMDGLVPFDIRAEILYYLKLPGVGYQSKETATVKGKGSIETYSFSFYKNGTSKSQWRREYITYLEAKAICYQLGGDYGFTIKAFWLDKIACALYEQDKEYVFVNGTYQCSCDLYRRRFGNNVTYTLQNNQLAINQKDGNGSERWFMYYTPGRCGIPVTLNGKAYYVTPSKQYTNINGKSTKVNDLVKYTNAQHYWNGTIDSSSTNYLHVVTNDATKAVIYEGWDYITNKLASILVVAVDKDTGNLITVKDVPYSEFQNVSAGNYTKKAWEIPGYTYMGYQTRSDFQLPPVPLGVADTNQEVRVTITQEEAKNGHKKQIIFIYEKAKEQPKEARVTIYQEQEGSYSVLFTGSYQIDIQHQLQMVWKEGKGNEVVRENILLNENHDYGIETGALEQLLQINREEWEYKGYCKKTHPQLFLGYAGETLTLKEGELYQMNQLSSEKVHIILVYGTPKEEPIVIQEPPQLKVSYWDEKGNPIPEMPAIITEEEIEKDIVTTAKDLRENMYLYVGYTMIDSEESFYEIPFPFAVMGTEDQVITRFTKQEDRRHIGFIYRKIELKFDIDIIMEPNTLSNQLIGQKEGEDYWVLDEQGKVWLKVNVSGAEGLTITRYAVRLRIPFDVIINGNLVSANSINNLSVENLSAILVADALNVPVWVQEGMYWIDAQIEADVEGFGTVSANKQDDVEVVGRLYDFTVISLDGSTTTGDEKWKTSLFSDDTTVYKANVLPIGQGSQQPSQYFYGMKMGTTFYYNINTKGIQNQALQIVPKFYYVSKDGKVCQEADVLVQENGATRSIMSEGLTEKTMKLRNDAILKNEMIQELIKAQEISKLLPRYQYPSTISRKIGTLAKIVIPYQLSLPYVGYASEFQALYGENSLTRFAKTENELLTYASHWYGKYAVPAGSKVVEKGTNANRKVYTDGYLIVCFHIISLKEGGEEYLSYHLPTENTQWQKENLNQFLQLPLLGEQQQNIEMWLATIGEGYAPVVIYQVGVSTLDNTTSVGTH